MPDYAPLFMPGDVITVTTSAGVTGGKALMVSGNGTVATATATAKVIGVAASDIASGAQGPMHGRGQVHISTASGAITAGDQIVSAASGNVSSLAAASGAVAADINNARSVLGVALTTAADTALVTWMEC